MFPESPMLSPKELFKESNEKLSQLDSDVVEPGKVVYLRESTDKNYDIYRYKLVKGGTRGGIKDKYVKQIGKPLPEGTQFSDPVGNVLNKDRFGAGEIVYLRVPKGQKVDNKQAKNEKVKDQKESKNSPGKFLHVKDYVDDNNRGWRIFSYTFYSGGTYDSVASKYYEKMYASIDLPNMYLLPGRNFCDENGKTLPERDVKSNRFTMGDTVYIKVPNTHVLDKVPNISYDEIMNLPLKDIARILYSYKKFAGSDITPHKGSLIEHADKAGKYIMINGKKLYIEYDNSFMNYKIARTCIVLHESEGFIDCISLGRYDGKKDFYGIECFSYGKNKCKYRKGKLDL